MTEMIAQCLRSAPPALGRFDKNQADEFAGLSYRQVQMMSGHKDPKKVMRYDQHRENLDQNAVNHLNYV